MFWIGLASILYGVATGWIVLRLPAFVLGIALVLSVFGISAAVIEDTGLSAFGSVIVILVCCQIGYVLGIVLRSLAARLTRRPNFVDRRGDDPRKASSRSDIRR